MAYAAKIRQAAVLAYRFENGIPQVLLVTSKGRGRWVLPKGHIDAHETAVDAAQREAYEEAGIKGKIADTHIGKFSYQKHDEPDDVIFIVKVFPMRVSEILDSWPESDLRQRAWMSFQNAAKDVEESQLQELLLDFGEMLSETPFAEK